MCQVERVTAAIAKRETPGPIPNPEVKPFSADGTATERLWESRTPPDKHLESGVTFGWPHFLHFGVERPTPAWPRIVHRCVCCRFVHRYDTAWARAVAVAGHSRVQEVHCDHDAHNDTDEEAAGPRGQAPIPRASRPTISAAAA